MSDTINFYTEEIIGVGITNCQRTWTLGMYALRKMFPNKTDKEIEDFMTKISDEINAESDEINAEIEVSLKELEY